MLTPSTTAKEMPKRKAKIYYTAMDDFWRKEEKLAWLRENPIHRIAFESITPEEKIGSRKQAASPIMK